MTAEIVHSVAELRNRLGPARARGARVGLVPTMGYLHEGHLALVEASVAESDLTVVSIYVNPTQFGAGEDLDAYPSDLEQDVAKVDAAGADIVFIPSNDEMYPSGVAANRTWVTVDELAEGLCGAHRPGHFRGVATVVCKLFNLTGADVAYFGEKDFQQLAVIRQMVSDLCMSIRIVGVPTQRAEDGLALSSRNAYLSVAERAAAPVLWRALSSVRSMYRSGERRAMTLLAEAREVLAAEPLANPQFVELVDSTTLRALSGDIAVTEPRLVLAVFLGTTRLIDNLAL